MVVDLSGNDDWHNAVTEYRVCKKLLDEAVADEKEAKAALIKLANNKSSKGYGLTLSKVDRVGAIVSQSRSLGVDSGLITQPSRLLRES